ncbi:hypothetical protein GEMRC1_013900 [Eukaryota sp. GEM-RC1]
MCSEWQGRGYYLLYSLEKEHRSVCQSLKNTQELKTIQGSDARIEERKKMKKEPVHVEVNTIDTLVSLTSKTSIPSGQRLQKDGIPTKSITDIIGKKLTLLLFSTGVAHNIVEKTVFKDFVNSLVTYSIFR